MPLKPLPCGLSDCVIKDSSQTEIFLVQAGPAVGAAKRMRDRLTQAVLPIDASIPKVKGASLDTLLDDEAVKSIIAALGVGILLPWMDSSLLDMTRLRYGKLIIATKPTPIGRYIRDQVVSFLFRFNRPLLGGGLVYLCPLDKRTGDDRDFEDRVMKPDTRHLIAVRPCRSIVATLDQFDL